MQYRSELMYLGIDVGSTTAKVIVIDKSKSKVLFNRYMRHHAKQAETVRKLLSEVAEELPNNSFRAAVCGSGGKPIAEAIGAHYIQEVVANSAAVRAIYPQTRTAIELGGQDAKIVFFYYDKSQGQIIASDMRMNGSCAGGTGAFIDEIASLLKVPVEEFEALAKKGTTVHDISGRCGVFAKTNIQSLLNSGSSREDIALSAFHAIAKQTIGGLAQGLELKPPIIFEGGPLTFNPTLIRVFAERLNLGEGDIILPGHPETIVAHGAAQAIDELFSLKIGEHENFSLENAVQELAVYQNTLKLPQQTTAKRYFNSVEEQQKWKQAHRLPEITPPKLKPGDTLRVYLGIDAGSTTSKFVLLDENEKVVERFYSRNNGDPLRVVQKALLAMHKKYMDAGVTMEILGFGTTGYGEELFGKAFGTDYSTVETVAHAAAAQKFAPGASFILDIGGQDMKAIWITDDIVTNIMINEACSSGCGSFLENFAASLNIPVSEIAEYAFRAQNPANLGSRCTVFMNSSIITEQKNGKQADDIMAGLCRSIVENVFTKVVRITNPASLGQKVVVQGGTFKNDAVLRALEQYLEVEIIRAPYPGEMGCIGIALLTKQHMEEHTSEDSISNFIGFDDLTYFNYTQRENVRCNLCQNNCSRTVIDFSRGVRLVTGNRCERGAVIDDGSVNKIRKRSVPDMFIQREKLLFKRYDYTQVSADKGITIGLPRVLEFWNSMPFWSTFYRALGFEVKISHPSSRKLYEKGIPYIASDTVCFPAKLVHGHIIDLASQGVDRIFMPMVMLMPAEDLHGESKYVCSVVKGYPLNIRNSDDPEKRWNTTFDKPIFHWNTEQDCQRQICKYMRETYGLNSKEVNAAFAQGQEALKNFQSQIAASGQKIIADAKRNGQTAIVLASRPYQNDPLVCHDISRIFTQEGIAVLTADALPGMSDVDLRYTCAEVTNNFHTRMLSAARIAAESSELEYVQIVSFGCGHDAILTDEIIRIMQNTANKSPLILKLDEGDAVNSVKIRVKSFLETISTRRTRERNYNVKPLEDAFPTKFVAADRKVRTILVPNVSAAFCKLLSAIIAKQGFKVEPLSLGEIDEIHLGKKYVHNDICFPAQMVVGEALAALKSGKYQTGEVAIGMAKYCGDCRLSHYSAVLRRAMDAAGFKDVPIITTDPDDTKNMHPGLRLGSWFEMQALWAITMMDMLEELRRLIRPYELIPGETNRVFDESIDLIAEAFNHGLDRAIAEYRKAVKVFCEIKYDKYTPRPRVFVTGEYLVTFHPGSNFHIENYLESNGMEVILPRMANVFHKDFIKRIGEMKKNHVRYPMFDTVFTYGADKLFDLILYILEKDAKKHPLYHPCEPLEELAKDTDPIIDRTYASGEGWLIAAEIREYARAGVHSFVILQPFGCLPNHIVGRGVMKRVKEEFPEVQILPLDLEPDTSFANVENRLQMLIMNEKSRQNEPEAELANKQIVIPWTTELSHIH